MIGKEIEIVSAYLDEADVGGPLTEALAAHVDIVLPDDGVRVGAHSASSSAARAVRALRVAVDQRFASHDDVWLLALVLVSC